LNASVIVALQRTAGNAAVVGLLRERHTQQVQRCGPTPCDCPPQERAQYPAEAQNKGQEGGVQRDGDDAAAAPCGPGTNNPFCLPLPATDAPCTPFDSLDHAEAVWADLSRKVPLVSVTATRCGEVGPVWDAYFASTSTPFSFADPSSCVVVGAKTDPEGSATAERAADGLLQDIIDNLPFTLQRVTQPPFPIGGPIAVLRMPLQDAISAKAARVDLHPEIIYNNPFNAAANIAGAVGTKGEGSDIFGDDDRLMGGTVVIEVSGVDPDGAFVGQVRWVPHVHVKDTVDFCPGNLGASFQREFTVPMSKLEKQGLTRDVPITIDYDLALRQAPFSIKPFIGPPPPPIPTPPPTPTPRHLTFSASTLFEFGEDQLRPNAKAELLATLGEQPRRADVTQPFTVEGHTDSKGSDEFNMDLSVRRARAVANLLEKNYQNLEGHIDTTGFGESRPIAPNTFPNGADNPEGRQRNRRVEIRFSELVAQ
jgi:outer membrane protein OmpA-like peptidoglycan-associated protein